jgi:hypothetical protein
MQDKIYELTQISVVFFRIIKSKQQLSKFMFSNICNVCCSMPGTILTYN